MDATISGFPHQKTFNNEVQASKSAETMPNAGEKKIKYYRNPMGLPDTSPAPKKDSMGMDYIAVYDGDESDDGSIKLSVGKLQRTGVRSESVTMHNFSATIRAPGVIALDERRQSVMSLRFEGWVEKIEDVTTGTTIKKGQPLFRVYGPELSAAAAQYVSILGSTSDGSAPAIKGARRRLENLGVPDSVIAEMARAREVPLTLVWPAPRDGIVTERNISEGMRAMPGDALFKIADVSTVWALADVAERDLAAAFRVRSVSSTQALIKKPAPRGFGLNWPIPTACSNRTCISMSKSLLAALLQCWLCRKTQ